MECLAPDCTSQSTFHWVLLDLVCSRFTPFLALTLQETVSEREGKIERGVNFISGRWFMCGVGGRSHRASSGPPFLAWRHGKKAIPLDESITEMNEDGSTMMHEARRQGSASGHDAPALSVRLRTACAGRFIINCGYLEASRVALWAANETFIQFRDNIIRPDWFCGRCPTRVTLRSLGRKCCTCRSHLWESLKIYFFSFNDTRETKEPLLYL